MANSVNSRCSEQKRKASQSKLSSFFTLEKRQKSDSNAGEEVESPKTSPNLPTSIDWLISGVISTADVKQ